MESILKDISAKIEAQPLGTVSSLQCINDRWFLGYFIVHGIILREKSQNIRFKLLHYFF